MTRYDSVPIIASVTGYNTGIQMAKMYPYVYKGILRLMRGHLSFYCYEKGSYINAMGQGWCQQPIGSVVDGWFIVDKSQNGTYLFSAAGCNLLRPTKKNGMFAIGTEKLRFMIKRKDYKKYVVLGLIFEINGVQRSKRLLSDGCVNIESKEIKAFFWDKAGRMSHEIK